MEANDLNDWLKLMLEEIRRKEREREEALREHERRQPGARPAEGAGRAAKPRPAGPY
jgi:hypothetical protein